MFGRKIKLFKILGFEVGIDLSWIIIAVLIAWSLSTGFFPFQYRGLSTQTYWIMGIVGALGLFFSIIVHEFSHSLVARNFGIPMKGITLFIFGGVAEMGEEPSNAKAEFFMAIVGPLASLALALIFYGLYMLGVGGAWPETVNGVVKYLSMINGLLAFFNLIPAFPLDGGRVLRSVLWKIKGNLRWATRVSSQVGSGFGIFLIIFGFMRIFSGNFIGGMWFALIGLFVQNAAKMSYQQMITRQALEGEQVRRFMKSDPVTVPPDITVDEFVDKYVYQLFYKLYPVAENGHLKGCITTKEIKELPRDQWKKKKIKDLNISCSEEIMVQPDDDAMKAISIMKRNNMSRLMVVENEKLQGVIVLKDLLEFLNLKVDLDEV